MTRAHLHWLLLAGVLSLTPTPNESGPAISFPISDTVPARFELTNVASLIGLPRALLRDGDTAFVSGCYVPGDGGAGRFCWDSLSRVPSNGGTIISHDAGIGRWKRIFESAVSVKWFGAKGDGTTNDTPALQAALAAANTVYFPAGTYLMEPSPGDYIFALGNRRGLEFFGDGYSSVLKLGNNAGRSKSVFGTGNGQALSDVYFHDFACDLNGENNKQDSYDAPLRYNAFAYLFSGGISNIVFERLKIYNSPGSQVIRVANDSPRVADRVVIRDCSFYNFGLAISGNRLRDQSVIYVFGNVTVEGCRFENPGFGMVIGKGQTAIEYHSGKGSRFVQNYFKNVQLPLLAIADHGDCLDTVFAQNTMIDCAYFLTMPGPADNALRGFLIADNYFASAQEVNPALIWIGNATDGLSNRRSGIRISRNHIETSSAVQGRIGVFFNSSKYTDVQIDGNSFYNLRAPAISLQGPVGDAGNSSLVIKDNDFDSCGSTAAGAPVFPVDGTSPQILISTSNTEAFRALVIEGNAFLNSLGRDFRYWKQLYLGPSVRAETISVRMNTSPDALTPIQNGIVASQAGNQSKR